MVEFHKKEREELEKEHDKLFETLDEDRKKVVVYLCFYCLQSSFVKANIVNRAASLGEKQQWEMHLQATKSSKPLKFNLKFLILSLQSLRDLRTLHETKLKHLTVCDLEITYASLYGDKVTKL